MVWFQHSKERNIARMIRHEATQPVEIKPSDKSVWVCQCGLSQDMPMCDGSHSKARKNEQEGKLYVYDKACQDVVEEKDDV